MKILGISLGHDSNLCLMENNEILEVFEAERFYKSKRYKLEALEKNKNKYSTYQITKYSDLSEILDYIKNKWGGIYDAVALQNQGRKSEENQLINILNDLGFKYKNFDNHNHHLSHAASSYFTSPFEDSLILSFDGMGNDGSTILFEAKNTNIRYLKKFGYKMGGCYNNIGYMIGLKPDIAGSTAGKLMGLSSYGKFIDKWEINIDKYIKQYKKFFPTVPENTLNDHGKYHRKNCIGIRDISDLKEYLEIPKKVGNFRDLFRYFKKEVFIGDEKKEISHNLAKTVQDIWTKNVIQILEPYKNFSENLCIVGGCALNGIANFEIENKNFFRNIHYIPNPTDCGLSIGAAYLSSYKYGKIKKKINLKFLSPYLGSKPFDIEKLDEFKKKYNSTELNKENIFKYLSKIINQNYIVGVIRGRYEVGPRALGNRSILCNPAHPDMKKILNEKVKKREWYRPFAPVTTLNDSKKYFTNNGPIPYMSVICYTKKEFRNVLPSITHVDGSARLQTVTEESNLFLYNLIKEFEKISKYPILLNTSFNPGGQPILNFCEVGLKMLDTTDLDFVLIEDTLFASEKNKNLLKELN